jgi:hypothetical protein
LFPVGNAADGPADGQAVPVVEAHRSQFVRNTISFIFIVESRDDVTAGMVSMVVATVITISALKASLEMIALSRSTAAKIITIKTIALFLREAGAIDVSRRGLGRSRRLGALRHANTKNITATLGEGQIKMGTPEVYNGLIRMDNDATQTNNQH